MHPLIVACAARESRESWRAAWRGFRRAAGGPAERTRCRCPRSPHGVCRGARPGCSRRSLETPAPWRLHPPPSRCAAPSRSKTSRRTCSPYSHELKMRNSSATALQQLRNCAIGLQACRLAGFTLLHLLALRINRALRLSVGAFGTGAAKGAKRARGSLSRVGRRCRAKRCISRRRAAWRQGEPLKPGY